MARQKKIFFFFGPLLKKFAHHCIREWDSPSTILYTSSFQNSVCIILQMNSHTFHDFGEYFYIFITGIS